MARVQKKFLTIGCKVAQSVALYENANATTTITATPHNQGCVPTPKPRHCPKAASLSVAKGVNEAVLVVALC